MATWPRSPPRGERHPSEPSRHAQDREDARCPRHPSRRGRLRDHIKAKGVVVQSSVARNRTPHRVSSEATMDHHARHSQGALRRGEGRPAELRDRRPRSTQVSNRGTEATAMFDYTFGRPLRTPRSAQLEGQDQQRSQPTLASRSSTLRTVALRSGRHDDGQSGSIRSSAPFSERTMASFAAKLDQAAAGARPTQGTCQWLACGRGPLDFHHGHVRCDTARRSERESLTRSGAPRSTLYWVRARATTSTSPTWRTPVSAGPDPG